MLAEPIVAQCALLQSLSIVHADPNAPSVHFPPPYDELKAHAPHLQSVPTEHSTPTAPVVHFPEPLSLQNPPIRAIPFIATTRSGVARRALTRALTSILDAEARPAIRVARAPFEPGDALDDLAQVRLAVQSTPVRHPCSGLHDR
jgi:hypothetical protein